MIVRIDRYLTSIKDLLPVAARADFVRALAGDALAARRLLIASPKRLLGHLAFLGYQCKMGNPAYRALLKAVWQPKTRALLTEFWTPQVVRRMLARADFERPILYGPVTIFRPVEASARRAAAQLCWTRSRNIAISEALRINPANPRIVQATIAPTDILFFEDGCTEEIVPRSPPKAVTVQPVYGGIGSEVASAQDAGAGHRSSRR
jgi:hypothetical protein